MYPKCIINGCYVIDLDYPRFMFGDLYQINETTFALHGNGDYSQSDWRHGHVQPGRVAISVKARREYFDHCGVVILNADDFVFNNAASAYLADAGFGNKG